MNKKELINVLAERLNRNTEDVAKLLNVVIDNIADSLKTGETVKMHGFGKFITRTYGTRKCYNPVTGEEIEISPSIQPAFIPSAKFRARIKK